MKKVYEIDKDLIIEVEDGGGQLLGTLKDTCPYCGQADCYFDCDQSTWDDEQETRDGADNRKTFNTVMDGIEALLLALACEGVDVGTAQFEVAIQTAIQATANNI